MTDVIASPGQALQFHLALFDRVWSDARYLDIPEGDGTYQFDLPANFAQRALLQTAIGDVEGGTVGSSRDDPMAAFGEANFRKTLLQFRDEAKMLKAAETHYIGANVIDALNTAAEAMGEDQLHATDLPCPDGLIVLEKPLLFPDVDPNTGEDSDLWMPVRAIGWQTTTIRDIDGLPVPGVSYRLYTTRRDWLEVYVPSHEALIGPMEPEVMEGAEMVNVWLSDLSGWAFGHQWPDIAGAVMAVRKFLLSYWRWTFTYLIDLDTYHPNRREEKQSARVGRPIRHGHIKVVLLRRKAAVGQQLDREHGKGSITVRFVVRGHWRRQWYKSLGPARHGDDTFNDGSHRMVFIPSYWKGPTDAPIVQGHNVSAATR